MAPESARSFARKISIAASVATLTMVTPADASAFKVLHAFCAKINCRDGSTPVAPLVSDQAGNLYGTTQTGGRHGGGAIYRLVPPSGGAGKWKYSVLYSFCSVAGCADGKSPTAGGLIVDASDNLYGTTSDQGGTVFELSPGANSSSPWTLLTLHTFCNADGKSCADGDTPAGALSYVGASSGTPYDGKAALFGLTTFGGNRGNGTVFSLKSTKNVWGEDVLLSFCPDTNCNDGGNPVGALDIVTADFMRGSGSRFGEFEGGTVFNLTHSLNSWSTTPLHMFCAQTGCTDGETPSAGGVIRDDQDTVYGTTVGGGANGNGAAFQVVPASQQVTVLHSFCHDANCADGKHPNAGLLMTGTNTFFGTASEGGIATAQYTEGAGLIYKLTGSSFKILHKFCSKTNCTDGAHPFSDVINSPSGTLYGTAPAGGRNGGGVVFQITP